ncbi:MAG: hypothetical protein K2Y09_09030 [Nitrosomonas sp.]|nr:hypothetical protein [Nitrosomonas sp.]
MPRDKVIRSRGQCQRFLKEALINSTNVMKGEAHGTQQPRHINLIGKGVSTAQRSNSLVQSINRRFLNNLIKRNA